MARQSMVIGLGQFGMSLARALSRQGSEVLAVDIDPKNIAEIAPYVADAVVMDAMDSEALTALAPERRDTCVCAIGDENREGSIIVTALLKQLGAKRIVSRATDTLHARILLLVGAHQIVHPERDVGERLAVQLAWHNVVNVLPLGGELVMTEVKAPQAFRGQTLASLDLQRRFRVTVCAIRSDDDASADARIPDPHRAIGADDILMLVSTADDARELTEKFS